MAESLSDDILVQILKRLPVKYLLRCRCVEKSWHRLIQTRYFINIHYRHNKFNNKYLLFRVVGYPSRCSLRFDDKQCKEYRPMESYEKITDEFIETYETCNGLICFATSSLRLVYLWNPFIDKFKAIPHPVLPYDDPLSRPCTTGIALGYWAKIDDYKVIKLARYYDDRGIDFLCVHVYSLSTNSWKTVTNKNFDKFLYKWSRNSVVVNGVAYWLHNKLDMSTEGILCFDVEKEILREIMLPTQCCELKHDYSVNLVPRFGELLYLFYFNLSTKILEILVLEKAGEINEVWTKTITLDFTKIDGCWWPVGFRNNDDILLTRMEAPGCM